MAQKFSFTSLEFRGSLAPEADATFVGNLFGLRSLRHPALIRTWPALVCAAPIRSAITSCAARAAPAQPLFDLDTNEHDCRGGQADRQFGCIQRLCLE